MKTVLICAVGTTPQVVTETLYALVVDEGTVPAEIHVLTTVRGRRYALDALLDRRTGRYYRFCRDYGLDHREIGFDETCVRVIGGPAGDGLEDLRTREDNAAAGRWIAGFVRGHAERADVLLHASLAGGRKTMSYYLGHAMQMFGRRRDRLTHVLVSKDFETHPEFYYKPADPVTLLTRSGKQINTQDAEITLVDVPFLRLRDHLDLGEIQGDLEQMTAEAERQVAAAPDLVADLAAGAVRVAGRTCDLGRGTQLFSLYLHFLLERVTAGDGCGASGHFRPASGAPDARDEQQWPMLDPERRDDLWAEAARLLGAGSALEPLRAVLEADALNPYAEGFTDAFSSKRSKLNRKLKAAFGDWDDLLRLVQVASEGRAPARYGVRMPAARIRFVGVGCDDGRSA